MLFEQYRSRHPLKKFEYSKSDVEKIRKHAFDTAHPATKMTRSQKQNAYMWGVVYKIISGDTGYSADEVHQLMGEKFLSYEKKGKKFVLSTTTLNTKEMEGYLEDIRRFASMELSIDVPVPNETPFSWEKPNDTKSKT